MHDLQQLTALARSWLGTPFRPDVAVRGRGADCKFLVLQLIDEWLGRMPAPRSHFINPVSRYSDDGMIEAFERWYGDVYERGAMPIRGGDVLIYRINNLGHGALALDDRHIVHVWKNGGVIITRLDQFKMPLLQLFHLKSMGSAA